jgi:hypothetical protein
MAQLPQRDTVVWNEPYTAFPTANLMKLSEETRRWLIPLAWLATAAITFCLGRFVAFIETPATKPAIAASATLRSAPASTDEATGAVLIETVENRDNPLQRLTGGKPMDEWLKNLLAQEDEISRMQGFLRLLELLGTSEEIEQALNVLLTNSNGWSRSKEFSMLLQKWAQFDPVKAMGFVEKLKDNGTKFGGYRAVLSTWTRRNAQEAIAWAEQNGPKDPDDRDGNWPMATIVDQIARTDASWALRLTEAQPVSRARGRMIESVVGRLVSQKGEEFAKEAAMEITDESLRNATLARLAGQLAGDNPQATAAWVTSLPPGESRQHALGALIEQWSDKDPVSAATFLTRMPPSPETDESRARLADNIQRKDPEGALAWAGTISEEQSRTRTMSELLRNWFRRDPDAARKWMLQDTQVPDDVKLRFPTQVGNTGGAGFRFE